MVENAHRYYDIDIEKQQEYLRDCWKLFNTVNNNEWKTWDINEGIFKDSLQPLKKDAISLSEEQLENDLISLLDEMKLRLKDIYDKLTRDGENLAQRFEEYLATLHLLKEPRPPSPGLVYEQFEFRDMYFYPIEVLSGLGERDKIDVVRISPKDATEITCDAQKKLAGDAVGHFGGFLDKKWRRNDIMWGRLDAAELIIKTLYPNENRDEAKYKKYIDSVLEDIVYEELPEAKESKKGYKKYLIEDYHVGEEGLGDLPAGKRANLGLTALQSIIGMLRFDSNLSRTNKSLKFLDRLLLKVLNFMYPFLSLFVQSTFGTDTLIQKIVQLLWLILGSFSLLILALFVTGKLLNIGWLNISWQLAGIASLSLAFTVMVFYLSEFMKQTRKTWLRVTRFIFFCVTVSGIILLANFLREKLAGIDCSSRNLRNKQSQTAGTQS